MFKDTETAIEVWLASITLFILVTFVIIWYVIRWVAITIWEYLLILTYRIRHKLSE